MISKLANKQASEQQRKQNDREPSNPASKEAFLLDGVIEEARGGLVEFPVKAAELVLAFTWLVGNTFGPWRDYAFLIRMRVRSWPWAWRSLLLG